MVAFLWWWYFYDGVFLVVVFLWSCSGGVFLVRLCFCGVLWQLCFLSSPSSGRLSIYRSAKRQQMNPMLLNHYIGDKRPYHQQQQQYQQQQQQQQFTSQQLIPSLFVFLLLHISLKKIWYLREVGNMWGLSGPVISGWLEQAPMIFGWPRPHLVENPCVWSALWNHQWTLWVDKTQWSLRLISIFFWWISLKSVKMSSGTVTSHWWQWIESCWPMAPRWLIAFCTADT